MSFVFCFLVSPFITVIIQWIVQSNRKFKNSPPSLKNGLATSKRFFLNRKKKLPFHHRIMGVYSMFSAWRSQRNERLTKQRDSRQAISVESESVILENANIENKMEEAAAPVALEMEEVAVVPVVVEQNNSNHKAVMEEVLSSAFDREVERRLSLPLVV
jgi:hypothetical protein